MSLPERPEYDDRDGHDQYGLALPFVCVASKGGPYDDAAFVAGFQLGEIHRSLSGPSVLATTALVYAALEEQVDLVAMLHGFETKILWRDESWIHVGFHREREL